MIAEARKPLLDAIRTIINLPGEDKQYSIKSLSTRIYQGEGSGWRWILLYHPMRDDDKTQVGPFGSSWPSQDIEDYGCTLIKETGELLPKNRDQPYTWPVRELVPPSPKKKDKQQKEIVSDEVSIYLKKIEDEVNSLIHAHNVEMWALYEDHKTYISKRLIFSQLYRKAGLGVKKKFHRAIKKSQKF